MDNVFHPPRERASVTPSVFSRRLILLGRSTSGVNPSCPAFGGISHQPLLSFIYFPELLFIFPTEPSVLSIPTHTHTHLQKAHLFDFLVLPQSHLWIHNSPCRIPPSFFPPTLIPQSPLGSSFCPCVFRSATVALVSVHVYRLSSTHDRAETCTVFLLLLLLHLWRANHLLIWQSVYHSPSCRRR